jgi:hypothetical protein
MVSLRKHVFFSSYIRVLTQAWSSEDFSRRLEVSPRDVLAECGLETPAGSQVEVVRSGNDEPDLGVQLALWSSGNDTGRYVLHVPYVSQIAVTEVDGEDLGDLAGGVSG